MSLPDTMRAWRVTSLGEPADALSLDIVPVPAPAPGEVLLRVGAVAANFPDVLLARGQYQVRPELPFVPGVECSGTIVAVGDGVTGLEVGRPRRRREDRGARRVRGGAGIRRAEGARMH